MTESHTPGPWHTDGRDIVTGKPPYTRGQPNWRYVASCHGSYATRKETDANARLIAAAPDMLAALRDIIAVCEDFNMDGEPEDARVTAARAVIAKATA